MKQSNIQGCNFVKIPQQIRRLSIGKLLKFPIQWCIFSLYANYFKVRPILYLRCLNLHYTVVMSMVKTCPFRETRTVGVKWKSHRYEQFSKLCYLCVCLGS